MLSKEPRLQGKIGHSFFLADGSRLAADPCRSDGARASEMVSQLVSETGPGLVRARRRASLGPVPRDQADRLGAIDLSILRLTAVARMAANDLEARVGEALPMYVRGGLREADPGWIGALAGGEALAAALCLARVPRQPDASVDLVTRQLVQEALLRAEVAAIAAPTLIRRRPILDAEAAIAARDAVVRGDLGAVRHFVAKVLHRRPTQWTIDVVSNALIDEGLNLEAFVAQNIAPDEISRRFTVIARRQARILRPLWETRLARGRMLLFSEQIAAGAQVEDLAVSRHLSDTDGSVGMLAAHGVDGGRIDRVLSLLSARERLIALAYASGDATSWAGAGLAVGGSAAEGAAVARKLRHKGALVRARLNAVA